MSCGLFAISTVSCDTTSVSLSSPSGYAHYRWFDSAAASTYTGTPLDTNQTATLAYPSTAHTYAVILTPYTGYGCPDTLYTRVYPSHLAFNRTHDTTVCFSGITSYTLTTGATDVALPLTYSWSPDPSLSCTTCANPVATPSTTTTYHFTVTDAVGCFASDSITIAGNTIGTTIDVTNVSCYGFNDGRATATLTSGRPPFTYSWTTSPVQTSPTAINLLAGTYTFSVTDSTGCTASSLVVVTQPAPTILTLVSTRNPSLCGAHDGNITISGLLPSTRDTISYTFNGASNTVVLTASATGTIVLDSLYQGTYDHIGVVTHGCQYNVLGPFVLSDPAIPPAPTVTVPTYCQFDLPSALSASATGGTITWYGPGIASTGTTTAPTPSTATPGIDTFYVTQTIAGCVSPRSANPVVVIAKPSVPTVADTTYCQFSTASRLLAGGLNLKWYTTSAGGTDLGAAPTPNTSIAGTTTWYVSQSVNGCESDRAAIAATILLQPVFTIAQSRPYTCQFDTLSFTYNGPSLTNAGYNWVLANGDHIVTGTAHDSSIVVRFDSLFFQTVTLTASDYNGRCSATDTLHINVVPQPTAISVMADNICQGDSVSVALASRAANADHFSWDFDHGTVITANSNSGGPYVVSWNTPGIHIVKLTAITVEGCAGKPVNDTVKVIQVPNVKVVAWGMNANSLCLEDSVHLSNSTSSSDSSDYRNTYVWTPSHFFHNTNRSSVWGKIETPGYVTLTVTNAFGCKNSDSLLITPDACCTVKFPTGFTPNHDGRNDLFRPIFSGYHRFHYFKIQNRWGQLVFESTNNKVEWDGTYGGVPQDMGVYYYYIKYDCGGKTVETKGDVTLIR